MAIYLVEFTKELTNGGDDPWMAIVDAPSEDKAKVIFHDVFNIKGQPQSIIVRIKELRSSGKSEVLWSCRFGGI